MDADCKRKMDLAALEQAIKYVKAGGYLSLVHVSKNKKAHDKFMKQCAQVINRIDRSPSPDDAGGD